MILDDVNEIIKLSKNVHFDFIGFTSIKCDDSLKERYEYSSNNNYSQMYNGNKIAIDNSIPYGEVEIR